jgi:hypothetical protein
MRSKRYLAIFLTIMLCVSIVPFGASAAGADIEVMNVKFMKGADEIFVSEAADITSSVVLYTDAATSVAIILASYDESGKALTGVSYKTANLMKGYNSVDTEVVTMNDDEALAKVMIWNADSMTPVSAPATLSATSRQKTIDSFVFTVSKEGGADKSFEAFVNPDIKTIDLYVPTHRSTSTLNNYTAFTSDLNMVELDASYQAVPPGTLQTAGAAATPQISGTYESISYAGGDLDLWSNPTITVTAADGTSDTYTVSLKPVTLQVGSNFNGTKLNAPIEIADWDTDIYAYNATNSPKSERWHLPMSSGTTGRQGDGYWKNDTGFAFDATGHYIMEEREGVQGDVKNPTTLTKTLYTTSLAYKTGSSTDKYFTLTTNGKVGNSDATPKIGYAAGTAAALTSTIVVQYDFKFIGEIKGDGTPGIRMDLGRQSTGTTPQMAFRRYGTLDNNHFTFEARTNGSDAQFVGGSADINPAYGTADMNTTKAYSVDNWYTVRYIYRSTPNGDGTFTAYIEFYIKDKETAGSTFEYAGYVSKNDYPVQPSFHTINFYGFYNSDFSFGMDNQMFMYIPPTWQ